MSAKIGKKIMRTTLRRKKFVRFVTYDEQNLDSSVKSFNVTMLQNTVLHAHGLQRAVKDGGMGLRINHQRRVVDVRKKSLIRGEDGAAARAVSLPPAIRTCAEAEDVHILGTKLTIHQFLKRRRQVI